MRGGCSATGEAAAGGRHPACLALDGGCRTGPSAALSLAWGRGWARPPRPPLQPPSRDPSWRVRMLSSGQPQPVLSRCVPTSAWPGCQAVTRSWGAWPALLPVRTASCPLTCPPCSLICRALGGGQDLDSARSCVCQTREPWAGACRHLLPRGHTCTSRCPICHAHSGQALGLRAAPPSFCPAPPRALPG